jgi:hypothetical protein
MFETVQSHLRLVGLSRLGFGGGGHPRRGCLEVNRKASAETEKLASERGIGGAGIALLGLSWWSVGCKAREQARGGFVSPLPSVVMCWPARLWYAWLGTRR